MLKKIPVLVVTLFGASLIAFFLIRLVPGDPVTNLLGERGGSAEQILEMRERLGLNDSLLVQYFKFVKNALRGDLGDSVISHRPVSEEFWARFPATLELGLISIFWAAIVGIIFGILAARKRGGWLDYGVMGFSLVGYSMPIFWLGLVLILLFSVQLGWLPVSGRISPLFEVTHVTGFLLIDSFFTDSAWDVFIDSVRHMILPAIALGTIPMAIISRVTRSSLLEVLGEDYIRTAKAKGVSEFRLVYIHALRNALIPVITIIGVMVGSIMTGAVLTETIFSWPGVGRWLVISVLARDYPVVQGGILYASIGVVFVNVVVDYLYMWAYPKIRAVK